MAQDIWNYSVGDHVYVAPPYETRDGSPYMICRVLALAAADAANTSRHEPKAKVAYYLRRRDVTNRSLADHRVIFATFMDGLVPMSHIRGRCRVMHKDYLADPEKYKREDDSFVFSQIYDRFMHKPFDLIPTSQVLNAPDNILEYLRSNFEFVCTELGSSSDLCDAMQGCTKCHAHAAKDSSVTCCLCGHNYHLTCLEPPLSRKPALGWRWSCIPCTISADSSGSGGDDDEEAAINGHADGAKASVSTDANGDRNTKHIKRATLSAPRVSAKKKSRARVEFGGKGPELVPQLDVSKWKQINGWPWRYFGQYVDMSSILDPHDSIWPRASTRTGSRFQASDIPGDTAEPLNRWFRTTRKPGRKRKAVVLADPAQVRGEDGASTLLWSPTSSSFSNADVDDYMRQVRALPSLQSFINVDALILALKVLAKSSTVDMAVSSFAEEVASEFTGHGSLSVWNDVDKATFRKNIDNFDDQLSDFRSNLPRKTNAEIVHHYYYTAGHSRQDTHPEEAKQQDEIVNVLDPLRAKESVAQTDDLDEALSLEEQNADKGSMAGSPPPVGRGRARRECAICYTDNCDIWYRCPDGIGDMSYGRREKVMCDSCSTQWRRYGNPHPALSQVEIDTRAARDGKKRKQPTGHLGSGRTARSKAPTSVTASTVVSRTVSPVDEPGNEEEGTGPLVEEESTNNRPTLSETEVEQLVHATDDEADSLVEPPQVSTIPIVRNKVKSCVMCKRPEPKQTNYTCAGCGVVCHSACYGIKEKQRQKDWYCDACEYDRNQERPIQVDERHCELCPHKVPGSHHPEVLKAFKMTDSGLYVHLLCAVWNAEPLFDDIDLLKSVSDVEWICSTKRNQTCSICLKTTWVPTIRCSNCPKIFHPACAWLAGYRFAIEVMPLAPEADWYLPSSRFKDEEGDMRTIVICKSHPHDVTRRIYDLGQKDKATGLTAILAFVKHCKWPYSDNKWAMWRATHVYGQLNVTKEIKAALMEPKSLGGNNMQYGEEDIETMEWLYAPKAPYIKPAKGAARGRKRVKTDDVSETQQDQNLANAPAIQPSIITAEAKTAILTEEAEPKMKQRRVKRKAPPSEQATEDVSSLSEDEVMPSASTARSRTAARPVRGVRRSDILQEAAGAVDPPGSSARAHHIPISTTTPIVHRATANVPESAPVQSNSILSANLQAEQAEQAVLTSGIGVDLLAPAKQPTAAVPTKHLPSVFQAASTPSAAASLTASLPEPQLREAQSRRDAQTRRDIYTFNQSNPAQSPNHRQQTHVMPDKRGPVAASPPLADARSSNGSSVHNAMQPRPSPSVPALVPTLPLPVPSYYPYHGLSRDWHQSRGLSYSGILGPSNPQPFSFGHPLAKSSIAPTLNGSFHRSLNNEGIKRSTPTYSNYYPPSSGHSLNPDATKHGFVSPKHPSKTEEMSNV